MNRNTTVDIAKSIGIILVVMGHANFAPASPGRFFHMPLFFFLTGYLSSFNQNWKVFLKKKITSLYIPFLICELVFITLHNVFYSVGILDNQYTSVDFFNSILHVFLFDSTELMLAPLWFMTALFFVDILSYGFCFIRKKWNISQILLLGITFLLMLFGVLSTRFQIISMPWSSNFKESINVTLVALFFCYLGHVVKGRGQIQFSSLWFMICGVLYLYVAKLVFHLSVDMRTNTYSHIVLWLIACVFGIYSVMFVSHQLSKWPKLSQFFAYIGRNSLIILFLHIIAFKLVGLVQVYFFNYPIASLAGWNNVDSTGLWSIIYVLIGVALPLALDVSFKTFKTKIIRRNR